MANSESFDRSDDATETEHDWKLIDSERGIECRTLQVDDNPRVQLRWPNGSIADMGWDEFNAWRESADDG